MRIEFTTPALQDMEELRTYLAERSPSGLKNILAAIENRIRLAAEKPSIGRQSPIDDVRELIEPKYGFLIPYSIKADTLFILRVYRNLRAPLSYEDMDIPE